MPNKLQLQPFSDNMRMGEIIEACRKNFQVLLDAYLNGANAVLFKGDPGGNGNAGQRGASVFQLTYDNILAAYNALTISDSLQTVYRDKTKLANLIQQAIDSAPNAANSAFRQLFSNIVVVDQIEDVVNYDMLILDNGFSFILVQDGSTFKVEATAMNLLTTSDWTDIIQSMIESYIKDSSESWPIVNSKLYGSVTANGVLPDTISADWQIYADLAWLAIVNSKDATTSRAHEPVTFVGSTDQLKAFFNKFASTGAVGMMPTPYHMPLLCVRLRKDNGYAYSADKDFGTDEKAPSRYGFVLFDEDGNGQSSAWPNCNATVTYERGRLWFEVEKAKGDHDGNNMAGKFFMSKRMFKFWTGASGMTIIGSTGKQVDIDDGTVTADTVEANTINFTKAELRSAAALATDNLGNIIPATGSQANPVPIGTVIMWPGTKPPDYDGSRVTDWTNSDWRICDGSQLSTSMYSKLYSVIGTRFGGTTTNFALPNFSGRMPIGAETGGTADLGEQGGEASTTLLTTHMPSHSHSIPGHTHTLNHTHTFSGTTGSGSPHKHATTTTIASNGSHQHSMSGSTSSNGSHAHAYKNCYFVEHGNGYVLVNFIGDWNGNTLQGQHVDSGFLGCTHDKDGTGSGTESQHVAGSGKSDTDNNYLFWFKSPSSHMDYAGSHTHSLTVSCSNAGSHQHTATTTCDNESVHTHSFSGTTSECTSSTSSTSLTTNATGGGAPHNNMPPFLGIYFIIKVQHTE